MWFDGYMIIFGYGGRCYFGLCGFSNMFSYTVMLVFLEKGFSVLQCVSVFFWPPLSHLMPFSFIGMILLISGHMNVYPVIGE